MKAMDWLKALSPADVGGTESVVRKSPICEWALLARDLSRHGLGRVERAIPRGCLTFQPLLGTLPFGPMRRKLVGGLAWHGKCSRALRFLPRAGAWVTPGDGLATSDPGCVCGFALEVGGGAVLKACSGRCASWPRAGAWTTPGDGLATSDPGCVCGFALEVGGGAVLKACSGRCGL